MDEPYLWSHKCQVPHSMKGRQYTELRLRVDPKSSYPQLPENARGNSEGHIAQMQYDDGVVWFVRYFFSDYKDAIEFKLTYG